MPGELLFVGQAAARVLDDCGICTISALAQTDRDALIRLLGKQGGTLHDYATGAEHSPVVPVRAQPSPKSVGNGSTFRRNLAGWAELRTAAAVLSDEVAVRLRGCRMKCTTVQVTIRSPDFKDICRQKRLEAPTCISRDILNTSMDLITSAWQVRAPVRALTITAQGLIPEEQAAEQLDLFHAGADQRRERLERLERTVDGIRSRYGRDAISLALPLDETEHTPPPTD